MEGSKGVAQAGLDCSVLEVRLGHEVIETTQTCLHAHVALKQAALIKLIRPRTWPPSQAPSR